MLPPGNFFHAGKEKKLLLRISQGVHPGQLSAHPVDEVEREDLKIAPASVSANVSVARSVLCKKELLIRKLQFKNAKKVN